MHRLNILSTVVPKAFRATRLQAGASRTLAASALAIALAGCSLTPGQSIGTGLQDAKPTAAVAGSSATTTDAPPPGSLVGISAELIREQRAERAARLDPTLKTLKAEAAVYRIGPGDVLNIVLWGHSEVTLPPAGALVSAGTLADPTASSIVGNGYNVGPDGFIQFPYASNVKVAGLTEGEAREVLMQRLAKYYKDPQLTVRIQAYRSERVFVEGEVRVPGLQSVNDMPMTLPEVISRAGGLTPAADRSSIAVTRNGNTVLLDLQHLVEAGVNPASVLLRGGDMVRVLSRDDSKVFVLGEVLRPTSQPMRNGRMTLNEALADAGGINPVAGDPRQVYVVRYAPQGSTIYHLDATNALAFALAEGFELKPRDVVYVDPAPLVRWSRVINLVLPSAQAINTTGAVVR